MIINGNLPTHMTIGNISIIRFGKMLNLSLSTTGHYIPHLYSGFQYCWNKLESLKQISKIQYMHLKTGVKENLLPIPHPSVGRPVSSERAEAICGKRAASPRAMAAGGGWWVVGGGAFFTEGVCEQPQNMCESVERQTSVSTYGLAWKINVQSEIVGIAELWEGWWSTEVINTMELLHFIV